MPVSFLFDSPPEDLTVSDAVAVGMTHFVSGQVMLLP